MGEDFAVSRDARCELQQWDLVDQGSDACAYALLEIPPC